jgi:tRNA modification GTPase
MEGDSSLDRGVRPGAGFERGVGETIVALASAPGRGAVSVIRLSGPGSLSILATLAGKPGDSFVDRRATVASLYSQGARLDQAVVTVFRGPRSYTGEDVVEVSCHGSPWVVGQVVRACVAEGARMARPGEYTLRAFLSGRLDLVQAEAVNDLIRSETAYQAAVARSQLEGSLSRALQPVREEFVDILCHLETALEFVEEDVTPDGRTALARRLERVQASLHGMGDTWRTGRVLREGARVVLAGRPNVGKSSLFNRLVREERALVTAQPGTTRDALREYLDVEGVPIWLVDTAGLREGELEEVEQLGVDRSRVFIGEADLVLLVVDGAVAWSEPDRSAWEQVRDARYLLVLNKLDQELVAKAPEEVRERAAGTVSVSARTGLGVEGLSREMARLVCAGNLGEGEPVIVTNLRQRGCLETAEQRAADAALRLREGWSEEFAAYEIRRALETLSELVGAVTTEDVLGRIFSSFCIGK